MGRRDCTKFVDIVGPGCFLVSDKIKCQSMSYEHIRSHVEVVDAMNRGRGRWLGIFLWWSFALVCSCCLIRYPRAFQHLYSTGDWWRSSTYLVNTSGSYRRLNKTTIAWGRVVEYFRWFGWESYNVAYSVTRTRMNDAMTNRVKRLELPLCSSYFLLQVVWTKGRLTWESFSSRCRAPVGIGSSHPSLLWSLKNMRPSL